MANPHITLSTPKVRTVALLGWGTNLVLYIGLTAAIAYRLWWADLRVSQMHGGRRYAPALHTIVESGFIFASATVVVLVLVIIRHPGLLASIAPTTQLAVRAVTFGATLEETLIPKFSMLVRG